MSEFTDDIDWYDDESEVYWVVVTGAMLRETKKAFLVRVPDDELIVREVWLPKSQVEQTENGGWLMPQWLADANGLDYVLMEYDE